MFRPSPSLSVQPASVRPGLALLTIALLLTASQLVPPALAADASPMLIDPLDPRAEGEGPGLVGSPVVAALAVIALGALIAAATAVYVRLTRR